MFDFLPDDQRKSVLDYLSMRSGAPENLVRPPEQGIEPAPAAIAPAPKLDTAPRQSDSLPPDDTLDRYKAAQGQDRETREQIARSEWFRGLLGNAMDPKKLQVNAAGDVANEVGLRHQIAQEGRAASLFPSQLRATNAGASEKEADAALKGARVPYAGAEAAADAALKQSHAQLFGQQAKKGEMDLADAERLRQDEWDANGASTALARDILKRTGQSAPPGPYAAWKHLLPEAVKLRIGEMAAERLAASLQYREKPGDKHFNAAGAPPADFEWDPEVEEGIRNGTRAPPQKKAIEEATNYATAGASILDFSTRLEDFLKKHPDGAVSGKDAAEVEPFVQAMQVMARKANDMGVYRAYDKPLLDKIITDPTELSTMIKSKTGLAPILPKLRSFLDETKQRALTAAQQVGWRPAGNGRWAGYQGRKGGAAAAPAAPATGKITRTDPDTGETRAWNGSAWVKE